MQYQKKDFVFNLDVNSLAEDFGKLRKHTKSFNFFGKRNVEMSRITSPLSWTLKKYLQVVLLRQALEFYSNVEENGVIEDQVAWGCFSYLG